MTITNSSLRLVALVTGVAVALALMGAVAIAPAQAAGLTQTQIQSIVSLLASFGADQATINNVTAALNGQATPGTGGSNPNTGTCPALSRDLQAGSSGADVKALQVYINSKTDIKVSVSGAGSPGNETMTFGPATKAAVIKLQIKLGVTPAAGYVGAKTRAAIAATCGNTTPGQNPGPVGSVSVSAGVQPVNSLAPQGAARVPFTTFTLSNNSSAAVTINSVTVQRTGLGVDSNFSGVVLLDQNGLQIGIAKTLNSNHQANIGDTGFTLGAGQSMTFTVAGNIGTNLTTSGQVVGLQVVAINTSATVSGTLPISGASQTINTTLTIGSVSTSTSGFDPGAAQTRNIGDTNVRFTGIKFTAGSAEDLKLYSIRWRQVGSASASDLANIVTIANGTSYPTTLDASGRFYTTIFPGGLLVTKGNSIDVYVQGDLAGSNSASRTVDFDLDKSTDVYFVGQTYGYGIAAPAGATPWFNGYVTTVNGGTVTTISKANTGAAAAQNVSINVPSQPMGGFMTNFAGEAVSVQSMVFTISTSSLTATGNSAFTNITLVDENGVVVAGPVDATNAASGQTFTLSDTVTFPTGVHTYYLKGKIPSGVTAGSFTVTTAPASGWSNVTGQTTGNTVSLSGVASVTMNSMTVKAGAVTISLGTTPASQTITAGASQFTFANILVDASNSGEDVRMPNISLYYTSNASNNLNGCQIFDGATALNTGSNVVNTLTAGGATRNNFSFNNILTVTKGTVKTLAVKCNLSSAATSSSTYQFSVDTSTGDYSITGNTSGVAITPTVSASSGGTMTVGSASIALSVDSSSPASTTVSGGSTGQTIGILKARATNDTVTLTKIGLTLTSGAATNLTQVYLYSSGGTLLGTATFGSGQTQATSTLSGSGLLLPADTDVKITVKADFADVGTGKPGVEGAVVAVNPTSAEGNSTSGLVQSGGSGSTKGVRLYNSYPIFDYSTTGTTLTSGVVDLLTLNVTADAQGDVGLYKLKFQLSTSTATVVSPTFNGPNGSVGTVSAPDATGIVTVTFDSTSNTADATVGQGTTKSYVLRGTVSITGNSGTTGSVSTALIADTSASAIAQAASVSPANLVWSPLATTTLDVSTNDWTNGYALSKGCFATVGIGTNCTARVLSK